MVNNSLEQVRQKVMSTQKVLCTGNPNNPSLLAHGFQKIFPDATFIHKSNGWNLLDQSSDNTQRLQEVFSKHNTFINASYIAPCVQSYLLEVCAASVKYCNVFNIGSTNEYDGLGSSEYVGSKLNLRTKSLQLNSYRFKTHHIMLGGIDRQQSPDTADWLSIDEICNIVPWILRQRFQVPLICLDQPKQPW
jgi:hypothetical protein